MSDLRSFLQILDDRSELVRIQNKVDPSLEIAPILKKFDNGSAVFFEEVETSNFKVVGGVCGTRERACLAVGAKKENLHLYMNDACRNPVKPKVVDRVPVKEFIDKPDLNKIPVVQYYEKDAGPYTSFQPSVRCYQDR